MTHSPEPAGRPDPAGLRHRAAALFDAAARDERAGPTAQLHCLAALDALHAATGPLPAARPADPDHLITEALRLLAALHPADFADPDVLAAARHGRRALRASR